MLSPTANKEIHIPSNIIPPRSTKTRPLRNAGPSPLLIRPLRESYTQPASPRGRPVTSLRHECKGPLLLFDNDCQDCTRFARLAEQASKRWVRPVGLHTEEGVRIKSNFFHPNDRPDEMFWILVGDTGFGGRSGLLPLAREIVRGRII